MIDLHSIVAFSDRAKWTGLAITQEINRVPWENTISYSTVGKCVRMFVLSTKETDTPIIPNRMAISVLTTASPFCSQRAVSSNPPNCQKGDDVEIKECFTI
jgi:hypothetical protein